MMIDAQARQRLQEIHDRLSRIENSDRGKAGKRVRTGGLCKEIGDILRESIEQAGTEWQPIASAPIDGTLLLLCSSGGAVWVGLWRSDDEHPYGKAGWTRFNCDDVGWEPNNWQPLPAPPKQEGE